MERQGLEFSALKVGMKIVCICNGYNRLLNYNGVSYPDVFKKCGRVRKINVEETKFWITWNDPFYNTLYRGINSWSSPDYFAKATPEDECHCEETRRQFEEQRNRLAHAMKYL